MFKESSTTLLLLIAAALLTPAICCSAEVADAQAMHFGQIALHPSGDTFIINASAGPSSAVSSRSHVEGSYSGYVDFTSTDAGEYVTVNYPDSVTLSDGSMDITISRIQDYSQLHNIRTELPGGGAVVRFSIGGQLTLQGNENEATYTGTMNVGVFFD